MNMPGSLGDPVHTPELNAAVAKIWTGRKCQCAKPKREKQAFCWSCWNALEDCRYRSKLMGTFGSEYTTAYLACVEYLKEKGKR